jgi:hypothetical protein
MPQLLTKGKAIAGQFSLVSGVMWFSGSGAPVNSTTGAGVAEKGSQYVRTSNGAVYTNTGTKAAPTWTLVGTVAGDTITSAMMTESLLKYAEVSIASAAITDTSAGQLGHADGVVLVAAPAAGKALELVSAVVIHDYAGAAYTAGGNVTVNWAGGAAITGVVSAANSFGAAADKIYQLLPLAAAGNAMSVATGLNLVAASAFTQPGGATGVGRVKVAYRVHTTGL